MQTYSTVINPNHKLGLAKEDNAINKEMYQRLVERHTRPDIVNKSVHTQSKEEHVQAASRCYSI